MVDIKDMPPIDPRTREMLFEEMQKALRDRGITVDEDDGEILSALVVLYSHMLAGTVKRLNRTPEKHRAAFWNLTHSPPKPAAPGTAVVAFEVVSGYDGPVTVKGGTRMSADKNGVPVSFRLRRDVTAVPAAVTDVFWCDSRRGRFGKAESLAGFTPWDKNCTREPGWKADFIFQNIFGTNREAAFYLEPSLPSGDIDLGALLAATRWSHGPWPLNGAELLPLEIKENPSGGLLIRAGECVSGGDRVCIRMELLDPALTRLRIGGAHMMRISGSAVPEAVLAGERGLDPQGFYPFGAPFTAFSECGVFCSEALSQSSAELSVSFELKLEVTEERQVEPEEVIDYKWIMRKPLPKPKPVVYEACAGSVRLEYWNGEAYREIRGETGRGLDFTRENARVEIKFLCPEDIAPCEYRGKTGYYLRLSCGACDELYKLPRRVYTPYISGISFTYDYTSKIFPLRAESESLGKRKSITLDGAPATLFEDPPWGDALLLGFDRLDWQCRLKLYLAIQSQRAGAVGEERLKALLCTQDACIKWPALDFTDGLSASGYLWLDVPQGARPAVLFGRERYWVALCGGIGACPTISGIYLNAGLAENRVRCEESFPYSALKRRRITLSHTNIMRARVYVRSVFDDDMELWREYEASDGKFRSGFYKINYSDGLITFPPDIVGRGVGEDILDLIRVVYHATDGANANLSAGTINKMEEDIPFIQSVNNPTEVISGLDGESGVDLAARKQHALYSGGRVTTKRDLELFAVDNCPMVSDAKCAYDAESKTVTLAVRMSRECLRTDILRAEQTLRRQLSRVMREGICLNIVEWEESL